MKLKNKIFTNVFLETMSLISECNEFTVKESMILYHLIKELEKHQLAYLDQHNKIIKKFEIKKKIFESYNLEFKENTTKYLNLKNYILLSIICLFKYEKTKNLKFLNTSLKLNDLISSQRKKLIILEDILLYSFIIKKELEVIEILMNKVGVKNE